MEEDRSVGFSQQVMDEAADALVSVGWSAPSGDAELTSSDPFVQSIDASIQRDIGVRLDELLNPAKVCVCMCVSLCCKVVQSWMVVLLHATYIRPKPPTSTVSYHGRLLIWNAICIIFVPSLPL